MKLQKSKTFLSGLAAGMLLFVLFSFSSGKTASRGENVTNVTLSEAQAYFGNYMNSAAPINEVLKGISIDVNQLEAMNQLKGQNPLISSFRLYFGKDNAGNDVGLVVGVDANRNDITDGTIYSTAAWNFNLCPVICDAAGLITGN